MKSERMGLYSLMARLLIRPVDQELIDLLAKLTLTEQSGDALSDALHKLSVTAVAADWQQLDEEFQRLFIGLGRSELLPYLSYYQTGFLMERPLAQLRGDLKQLGFQRQQNNKQPEDHISAICEVMALLIREENTAQGDFFYNYINSWFSDFFTDLKATTSQTFYRAVAEQGMVFIEYEANLLDQNV